jgi:hypothetical protein
MAVPRRICAVNFWPGFSLETGLVKYLFDRALESFAVVASEKEADIVLTSVFPKHARLYRYIPVPQKWPLFPEKTIGIVWENQRPNYRKYRFSLSSDFDSYGGRNCRVPLWYMQLNWPGIVSNQTPADGRTLHGFEPLVEIDSLLEPRSSPNVADKELFCCMIASNPEPHRMLCVERLSTIERVDLFGPIAGTPYRASKYDLLSRYRFNLCFENSIFPGYYTEKLLQAWVGGCLPLYYSDGWFKFDFNQKALVNRIAFRSIDEFVVHVASLHASRVAMNEIFAQPLLTKRPTLDDAIAFLARSCAEIMNRPSRQRSIWPVRQLFS